MVFQNNLQQYTKKKGEWISWGDWLGSGQISPAIKSKMWLPWREAKSLYQKIVKENKIKNERHWLKYIKTHELPKGLPPYPKDVYTEKRAIKLSNNQR